MSGTFGGLNTALSALRYQQVALDVANNNVANVNTAGYVRRRAEAGAVASPGVPAMWSQYTGHGDGVRTQQVTRLADAMLDARARRESGNLSYLTVQQTALKRVEAGINEPSDNGLSAALLELRSAFHDLVSDPSGVAARETVLAKAGAVASAFKTQSDNLTTEMGDQAKRAGTLVQQVNDAATEMARLNETILVADANSTDVGALRDQRDLLAVTLAKLTGAEVTVKDDGQYDVAVGGAALVSGKTAATVTLSADALSVTVGTASPSAFKGELGGVLNLLNDTLPTYKAELDSLADAFVTEVNAQHALGQGSDGISGRPLFGAPGGAGGVTVVATAAQIAAADGTPGTGKNDGTNADKLANATAAESDYIGLVTRFGANVASVNRQTYNQETLTAQVEGEREQLAGVNLDEETVNMVAAQHAYEAAGKMMSIMDSILDTIINRLAAR